MARLHSEDLVDLNSISEKCPLQRHTLGRSSSLYMIGRSLRLSVCLSYEIHCPQIKTFPFSESTLPLILLTHIDTFCFMEALIIRLLTPAMAHWMPNFFDVLLIISHEPLVIHFFFVLRFHSKIEKLSCEKAFCLTSTGMRNLSGFKVHDLITCESKVSEFCSP